MTLFYSGLIGALVWLAWVALYAAALRYAERADAEAQARRARIRQKVMEQYKAQPAPPVAEVPVGAPPPSDPSRRFPWAAGKPVKAHMLAVACRWCQTIYYYPISPQAGTDERSALIARHYICDKCRN